VKIVVVGENRVPVALGPPRVTLNYIESFMSYRAVNTLHRCYKNKSMLSGGNRCVFGNPLKTHKCVLWAKRRFFFFMLKPAGSPSNLYVTCVSKAVYLTLVIENKCVCRYSDSLLAGWSGDGIPVGSRLSAPV